MNDEPCRVPHSSFIIDKVNCRILKNILPYSFFLLSLPLMAQDSLRVTKNFHFTDGVYFSVSELQSNQPAHKWEDLDVWFFTNPQTYVTQVAHISNKADGQHIDLAKVWALSLDGIPYIRLPEGETRREMPTFAAVKLRGKICYYAYPDWRVKKVRISAYNPLTGRPFRTGFVDREEEVFVEKMLHFESGEITDFTTENLLRWIQDDPALVAIVKELPPGEKQEKLFKCLLIYVDRHEAFLKKKVR